MSLRFIYGRAGSGKSYYCISEIKKRINENVASPLILLVPEQYTFQAERTLIKVLGTGGIIKTEVLSFKRMAYRVFSEVGGITYPHVNSASKCMIIYRILERMQNNFKVFSKASNQQGFVNTILSMITEFKRYNVTPLDLEKVKSDVSDNELLRTKLEELGMIYTEFDRIISERYRDSDEDLTMLSKKMDISRQFEGAEIWIDSFSGFTPQEYKVIEKLLQKASRVNIVLCTDCLIDEASGSSDVFSPVKAVVRKITKIAKENNMDIESPIALKDDPLYRFKDSTDITHLEKNFFAFPYTRFSGETQDIALFSSVNIYSEIENTARDIVRLCRDRGMRYKDIAVVCGNLEPYEKLIDAIFKEYDIPFFIDRKKRISNHPIIQLINSMFEIFLDNWTYEAVFRYLKTGLMDIKREDIDTIENYVLACGIKGSKWTQAEKWNYRVSMSMEENETSESESNLLNQVNTIRDQIVKPLIDFKNRTRGRNKAREICEVLYEFLCNLGIPDAIESRIEEFRKNGQLGLANEYSQVWNIIMEVFDQVVEVMGDESVGLERFSNLLKIAFSEYKIGIIPPSIDQVLVGNIERSKSHEVKALYVLGVNDGVFPSTGEQEGILTDRDRDRLKDAGLEIANDTRTNTFEAQYMIYTTLTTAGRYLRLSYPIADNEGRTMRPSIVISRIRKLFPGLKEKSNIVNVNSDEENMELVAKHIPTFNQLVSVLRNQSEGVGVNPLWSDVYRWYYSHEEWQTKCMTARSALKYSNMPKPISNEKVKKLYGNPIYSSVSRFEKYASCPFAYYAEYGMKAKERKVYRLTPPDIGTFMHAVIERFSKYVSEEGLSWRELDREWCTKAVSDIVDDLLERMQGSILNSSSRYYNLARRLKRVLTRSVLLIAEHIKRSSFDPIGYEVKFGDDGQYPPIKIELPTGDIISLTGRIDRIDAYKTQEGTYLRIVDYKSGNKAFKLSDIYYGMQIQLITYLDAIWNSADSGLSEPILPGGMLYFRIDDPIVKGSSRISEEDVERAIMKQLKMRGLLLADVKLIKEMDNQIEGDSLIIPARINKGDVLGRSSAASVQQFDILRKFVAGLVQSIGEEMLKGDISIKPYKKKRVTPCTYCNYASVCQFDPQLKDNKYRILGDKVDDEVWGLMGSKGDGESNGGK